MQPSNSLIDWHKQLLSAGQAIKPIAKDLSQSPEIENRSEVSVEHAFDNLGSICDSLFSFK